MDILGIIPARKNSKGIPGKNIKDFAGECLIDWTIEVALKSKLSQTVVTTDCEITKKHCQDKYGLYVIDRPNEFATDKAPMLPVIKHSLMAMNIRNQKMPDAICLLQPTNPLRRTSTIDKCIDMLEAGARSVTTVYDGIHPKKSYDTITGKPLLETRVPYDRHVDKVLTRSGSIFLTRTEWILDNLLLCQPALVTTDKIEALDLNDYDDWFIGEAIVEMLRKQDYPLLRG